MLGLSEDGGFFDDVGGPELTLEEDGAAVGPCSVRVLWVFRRVF